MKNITKYIVFSLLTLTFVQATAFTLNDTLSDKNFKYFEENTFELKKDSLKTLILTKYWIKKAKKENNSWQLTKAYKIMMHLVDKNFRLIYADSLLSSAITTKDDEIIGSAYLTIGAAHYDNKEYTKALNEYILANNYIVKTDNKYLIHKVKYTIALTKYFLGYYEEAIALLNQCLNYFKEENDLAYIKSMHAIGLCYTQVNRYDLATYYNETGIDLANKFEIPSMIPYFNNAEGINRCKQKQYQKAIQLLLESVKGIEEKKDYANQITTWFCLGKCYWELEEKEQSVKYFYKMHEGIEKYNYTRPDIREGYEHLIEYYNQNKNLEKQLYFINKLMVFDKIVNNEFKFLSYKIHKEYDTKTLLEKKKKIENELNSNKKLYITIVMLMSLAILCLFGWHLISKKREKEKFNQVMANLAEQKKEPIQAGISNSINLSLELTKSLTQSLESFEKNKKYLEKDMTLNKLATLLNTNTKYASLIIAHQRGKKTTTYINDLKIDFIVQQLIKSSKFRNYTNKALAEEAGFGSTQIFTLCFKNKIGMSPTSFIQQLNSSNQNQLNNKE